MSTEDLHRRSYGPRSNHHHQTSDRERERERLEERHEERDHLIQNEHLRDSSYRQPIADPSRDPTRHPRRHSQPDSLSRHSNHREIVHRDSDPSSRLTSEPQTAISTLSTEFDHHHHQPDLYPILHLQQAPHKIIPNAQKIYIGGLPDLTRLEDLQDCFSQLGPIKNIELKNGYGFVEYDSPQSASDAVSKYHEGTFLGSQIKVELSHGGSRPRHVAVSNNPEACYTCGIPGHWARDCPDADSSSYSKRRLRPRSRSPPARTRDDGYTRPPRHQLDPLPREYHARRRTPPLEPTLPRSARDRPPASAVRGGYISTLVDEKRHRPEHPLRDARPPVDPTGLPRGRSREPYALSPAIVHPQDPRDYYHGYRAEYPYRMAHPEPYPYHALPPPPREIYDHRLASQGMKAYPVDPAYYREPFEARPVEPISLGRYPERSLHDSRSRYVDRPQLGPPDRRDELALRRPPRERSSLRERSPRRTLRRSASPSRRRVSSSNYHPQAHHHQREGALGPTTTIGVDVREPCSVGPSYSRVAYASSRR